MDYLFSRIFRTIKYTISIVGGVACGVVIVTGALNISTIAIPICGGIALLPMGFIFFENTKIIADIEKAIIKLKDEISDLSETANKLEVTNNELETTSSDLKETKNTLLKETKILETMLSKATNEIDNLSDLLRKYKVIEHNLQHNVSNLKTNNDSLKDTTNELVKTKKSYEQQNKNLKENIILIENQLKEVIKLKITYENNINMLSSNNTSLRNSINDIKVELQNTQTLYKEARTAVKSLLIASGVLKDLGDDMVKLEKKTDENVTMMRNIMNIFGSTRSDELFEKLDQNEDGVVDKEEFLNILIHSDT